MTMDAKIFCGPFICDVYNFIAMCSGYNLVYGLAMVLSCVDLFKCFDSNCDGHIDLPEFVVAVSKCCRLGQEERLKWK